MIFDGIQYSVFLFFNLLPSDLFSNFHLVYLPKCSLRVITIPFSLSLLTIGLDLSMIYNEMKDSSQ